MCGLRWERFNFLIIKMKIKKYSMETRQIEWGDKDRTEVVKEPVPVIRERATTKCTCGARIQNYRNGE
jgi:hypothetical protein